MLQRTFPSLAIDDIMSGLAAQVPGLVSVTCCRIALLDTQGERFTIRTAYAVRDILWNPHIGDEVTLDAVPRLRQTMDTGQPVVLPPEEVGKLAAVEPAYPLLDQGLRSLAFVPLVTRGRVLGLISLGEMRSWTRSPVSTRKLDICNALALQAAMAMEAATSQEILLSVFVHELRGPLANLKLAIDAALRCSQCDEQIKGLLHIISLQFDRLRLLADIFLEARWEDSRGQGVLARAVNLTQVLTRVMNLYQGFACSHPIHVQVRDEATWALADEEYLMVVLCNLLDNAIKYSPQGGAIHIDVKEYDEHRLLITVTDQGVGIPAEHLDKIFAKFYRVKGDEAHLVDGSGLGLYVVKELLEAQNGEIWVKSQPGRGTTFSLTLPRLPSGTLLD